MTIDTDKIRLPKKKDRTTFKVAPDGKLYTSEGLLVSGEGMSRMSEKERQMIADILAENPALATKVKKFKSKSVSSEPDITKRAKGGMVKKYMGGGSVHKNKNKMLTTKGWGASRKT